MIIPFLEPTGGNCQDALILVEELAVREKPLGGRDGTAIEQLYFNLIQHSGNSALFY